MANRHLICNDCGDAKWLTQKQWQKWVDELGTTGKVKRNFTCKKCQILKRDDPYKYQQWFGKTVKKMRTRLREKHWEYLKHKNLNTLQRDFNTVLSNNGIDIKKVQYVTTPDKKFVLKVILKDIPLIGDIPISIYTPREKTY